MQDLWARILAGEANSPGSYSKRTVHCVGNLDKTDAELFMALCGFVWLCGQRSFPLVFDTGAPIYIENGINFDSVLHLQAMGFVQFSGLTGYANTYQSETVSASYFRQVLTLTRDAKRLKREERQERPIKVPSGHVRFTQVGAELACVCQASPVDGFFDYVKDQWSEYLPEDEDTEQSASADADKSGG